MAFKSKKKGKAGELEIAARLRELGFADARRGVQYEGGSDSPDVIGLPGFHLEVKRTEGLRLWDAREQARADAAKGTLPVVVHRANGKPWVAILDFDDFVALARLTIPQ